MIKQPYAISWGGQKGLVGVVQLVAESGQDEGLGDLGLVAADQQSEIDAVRVAASGVCAKQRQLGWAYRGQREILSNVVDELA